MLVLKDSPEPVLSLAFAPDAATLYAAHYGASGVRAWNLADRTASLMEADGRQLVGELVIHPSGRWAFGTLRGPGGRSCALDLNTGRVRAFDFVNAWDHLAVSPDGVRLATINFADDTKRADESVYALCGWKMTAAGPRAAWQLRSPADALAWWVCFVGNDTLMTEDKLPSRYSKERGGHVSVTRLAVRSAADGKVQATLESPYEGHESRHLFASPDGRRFVARRGLSLRVWDAGDWEKPPVVVPGNEDPRGHLMRAACFHPSGRYLLLASDGPSVTALDTVTWKPARRWNWKAGVLRAVAISPDGSLAAAAGPSGKIVVWDWDL